MTLFFRLNLLNEKISNIIPKFLLLIVTVKKQILDEGLSLFVSGPYNP